MWWWVRVAIAAVFLLATASGIASATDVSVSATVVGPEPVTISSLECVPDPFDPTTGPVSVSFDLSTAATATATITGIYGDLVAILGPQVCAEGYNALLWDGRDLVDGLVEPAWYTCTVQAADGVTQDSASCSLAVSYGSPVRLHAARVKPRVIRSSSASALMSVRLSRSANLSVMVLDSEGQPVRTFSSSIRDAGLTEIVWDVCDSSGMRVPPGRYSIIFEGTDTGGSTATRSAFTRVVD